MWIGVMEGCQIAYVVFFGNSLCSLFTSISFYIVPIFSVGQFLLGRPQILSGISYFSSGKWQIVPPSPAENWWNVQ